MEDPLNMNIAREAALAAVNAVFSQLPLST